jgi:2-desacetyl-2-hydroxyethyl bacteriochlorophyllide A dehydrogenase
MMQALLYKHPKNISLINLPSPDPGPDEVMIKTAYCGICGTDLHIIADEAPAAEKVIPGHEFSGHIEKVGAEVSSLKLGDAVAVDPNIQCGNCPPCKKGQIHFCQNLKPVGVFVNGGMAEYCLVKGSHVYKLPSGVSLVWGALTEPVSCIVHGWHRLLPLPDNPSILILGAGLIGLLWGVLLKQNGIKKTRFSEPIEKRQQIARQFEFKVTAPDQLIQNQSKSGDGFDVIIDCSGNPRAIEMSFPLIKPLGKFLFFGMCPQKSQISIPPFQIFQKELTLIGSVINPFTFTTALKLIEQIQVPIDNLDIKFFLLQDYQQAFQTAKSGHYTKVMFSVQEQGRDD